jgi:thiamine-monophosphate kinase
VAHTALGVGAEFDIVRTMVARYGAAADGIGDDAAVLDLPAGQRLVVSTDVSVEGAHFRADWLSPEEIGARATTAALSDLAAMAAWPIGIVVAFTLPEAWRASAPALADGVARAAVAAAVPIVGGDLSDGATLSLAVTVLGAVGTPVTRAGARAGDAVWVTGRLGGPGRAVAAWQRGEAPAPGDRLRFASPAARLREAVWLASAGVTAMIDISDGLGGDLGHIAAASGGRVMFDLDRIPCVPGATPEEAAASGEEYELACTGPATLDAAAFERAFGVPLTRVGFVEAAGRPSVVAERRGAVVALPKGFTHFAR